MASMAEEEHPVQVGRLMKHKCTFPGCELHFERPSRLQWHMCTHTGEKPNCCPFDGCDKGYASSTKLKRHIKTFHEKRGHTTDGPQPSDNPDAKYICKVEGCDKRFKKRNSLHSHKVTVHEKRNEYVCQHPGCGKEFSFANRLKRHVKIHEGYECEKCGEVLEKWTLLRTHMSVKHPIVHTCEKCDKEFRRPSDLKRHTAAHNNEAEHFKCPEDACEKSYDRLKNLNFHIEACHKQRKLYKCDHPNCEAAFPYKTTYERHNKYHAMKDLNKVKSYPNKGHRKIKSIDHLLPDDHSLPSTKTAAAEIKIDIIGETVNGEHSNSMQFPKAGKNSHHLVPAECSIYISTCNDASTKPMDTSQLESQNVSCVGDTKSEPSMSGDCLVRPSCVGIVSVKQ